jgi:hypothetical protein
VTLHGRGSGPGGSRAATDSCRNRHCFLEFLFLNWPYLHNKIWPYQAISSQHLTFHPNPNLFAPIWMSDLARSILFTNLDCFNLFHLCHQDWILVWQLCPDWWRRSLQPLRRHSISLSSRIILLFPRAAPLSGIHTYPISLSIPILHTYPNYPTYVSQLSYISCHLSALIRYIGM